MDRSGSMTSKRIEEAKLSLALIAPKVTELDSDGITLHLFATNQNVQKNIKTADAVNQLFADNPPT